MEENDASRIEVMMTPPLKIMSGSVEERGSYNTFPKGGEGTVVRLVDKLSVRKVMLKTSQKSITPLVQMLIWDSDEGEGGSKEERVW